MDRIGWQIAGVVFFIAGVVCVLFAPKFADKMDRYAQLAGETKGTVIETIERETADGRWREHAVIRFTTETGERVVFSVTTNGLREEMSVPLLYDPTRPKETVIFDARYETRNPIVGALFFGILFIIAGGVLIVYEAYLVITHGMLLRSGRAIRTDVAEVSSHGYSPEGDPVFRIHTRGRDEDAREHTFTSPPVYYDPAKYLENKQIEVRYDPRNEKRFEMDLRFLP